MGEPHGQSLDAAILKVLVSGMSNRFPSEIHRRGQKHV